MPDAKTSTASTAKPNTAGDAASNKDYSNDFPGPDFVQRELTPEQMPADAKVPSPLTQTNTSGTTSIGTPGLAEIDSADESIKDGLERYTEVQENVSDAAQKLADAHRDLDEAAEKQAK